MITLHILANVIVVVVVVADNIDIIALCVFVGTQTPLRINTAKLSQPLVHRTSTTYPACSHVLVGGICSEIKS